MNIQNLALWGKSKRKKNKNQMNENKYSRKEFIVQRDMQSKEIALVPIRKILSYVRE